VETLPVFSGYHFDSIPGTTVQESTIRSFTYTLLAADAEIRVDFNAPKGRMIVIGNPEHTGLDGTVLNAGG